LVSCFRATLQNHISSPLETIAELFRLRAKSAQLPVVVKSEDEVELVENTLLEIAGKYKKAVDATTIASIADALEGAFCPLAYPRVFSQLRVWIPACAVL
jgi:hypothetical protein